MGVTGVILNRFPYNHCDREWNGLELAHGAMISGIHSVTTNFEHLQVSIYCSHCETHVAEVDYERFYQSLLNCSHRRVILFATVATGEIIWKTGLGSHGLSGHSIFCIWYLVKIWKPGFPNKPDCFGGKTRFLCDSLKTQKSHKNKPW